MRSVTTLPTLVLASLLATACGPQDPAQAEYEHLFTVARADVASNALTGVWLDDGSRYVQKRLKIEPHELTFAFRCQDFQSAENRNPIYGLKVAAEVTPEAIRILERKETDRADDKCHADYMLAVPHEVRACDYNGKGCFVLRDRVMEMGIYRLLEASDGRDSKTFEKLSD